MFTFKATSKKRKRKDVIIRRKKDDDDDDEKEEEEDDNAKVGDTSTIDNNLVGDGENIKTEQDESNNENDFDKIRKRINEKKMKKKKKGKTKRYSGGDTRSGNTMSFSLDIDGEDEDYDENEGGMYDNTKRGKKSKRSRDKKSKKKMKKSSTKTAGGVGFGGGGMIPSHLNDDDNEDDDYIEDYDNDTERKKNGRTKHGFGMMRSSLEAVIHDDDDDDDPNRMITEKNSKNDGNDDNEQTITSTASSGTKSLYGKEALERLKAEQKTIPIEKTESSTTHTSPSNNNNILGHIHKTNNPQRFNDDGNDAKTKKDVLPNVHNNQNEHIPLPPLPSTVQKPKPPTTMNENDMDDDFIPFTGGTSSSKSKNNTTNLHILTGDEALMYTGELDDDQNDIHGKDVAKINKANLGTETLSNTVSSSNVDNDRTSQILMGIGTTKNDDNISDKNMDAEVDEGGRQWEEEIARRAGVGLSAKSNEKISSSTTTTTNATTTTTSNHQQGEHNNSISDTQEHKSIISNVTTTIRTTLENLNQMEEDLESSIGRRTHDQDISQKEAIQKENELQEIGDKFEYYQNLRIEMVNWIGALRYLSEKVTYVEKGIVDLYYDIAMKRERNWREWEDDVIAILVDRKMLDYVVGRQPRIESNNDETSVDEFGRDQGSLESLARMKRKEKRQRVRLESKDRRINPVEHLDQASIPGVESRAYEDSDLDVSDNEMMDRDERRSAYSDAINLLLNETEEKYSSPMKLLSTFHLWQTQNKADYDQCYANLALIDLINVFVRVENCQKLDLMRFSKGKQDIHMSMKDFSWLTALQEPNQLTNDVCIHDAFDTTAIKTQILTQEFDKVFLSTLSHPDKQFGCYDPFSTKQTESMVSFCNLLLTHLDKEEMPIREKISVRVFQYINSFIQNLAIPIVNNNIENDITDDVIIFSTLGQLFRLKKLICNLMIWYPSFISEVQLKLAKFCLLDVIAYRFLPILNISEKALESDLAEEALTLLKDIWKRVKDIGWLKIKDLTFSSAPLRSVATARNLI